MPSTRAAPRPVRIERSLTWTNRVEAGSSLGQLRDRLIARGGIHAQVLARGRAVRCALNQVMVDESSPVPDGAEVAFFPPVTGG